MEKYVVEDYRKSLMENPNHDAEYIDAITEFFEKCDGAYTCLVESLAGFQIKAILKLRDHFNSMEETINFVSGKGLNDTQLKIINSAFEAGVDKEKIIEFADKDIPFAKMNFIFIGLSKGYEFFKDVTIGDINLFSVHQLALIIKMYDDEVNIVIDNRIPAKVFEIMIEAAKNKILYEYDIDTNELKLSFNNKVE